MLQAMDRTMLYRSIDGDRIEHARLRISDAGGVADGTIIGLLERRPLRVRHELTCDSRWHVRNANIEVVALGRDLLSLSADESGIWRRVDGGTLGMPVFDCFDVAIGVTPVPVALTIRRIALEPREAAIVSVASIAVPSLDVQLIEHRYTCLAVEADHSLYRMENFDTGERTAIRVDVDGVVADQEGTFKRIWPTA